MGDAEELRQIQRAGGWVRNGYVLGRLAMTRSLGDSECECVSALPDIWKHSLPLGQRPYLLLASDGVWDRLSSADVCDMIGYSFKNQRSGQVVKEIASVAVSRWMNAT